jgi:hypothetical protein
LGNFFQIIYIKQIIILPIVKTKKYIIPPYYRWLVLRTVKDLQIKPLFCRQFQAFWRIRDFTSGGAAAPVGKRFGRNGSRQQPESRFPRKLQEVAWFDNWHAWNWGLKLDRSSTAEMLNCMDRLTSTLISASESARPWNVLCSSCALAAPSVRNKHVMMCSWRVCVVLHRVTSRRVCLRNACLRRRRVQGCCEVTVRLYRVEWPGHVRACITYRLQKCKLVYV